MFKIESYRKGIILSTIFNVFNKGLVFLNGILVAYYFGASHDTDIFFYTYNSLIVISAFFMSMNSSVIIPESMRIRLVEGNDKAMQFLNYFILLYLSVMLVGTALIVADPVSFFSVVSNFSTQQLASQKNFLYLASPLFALTCLITLLVDILTSYKFFTISMVVGIINGVSSILLVIAFHSAMGIKSVFYGFLLSYTLNLVILIYLLVKYLGWRFSFHRVRLSKRIWQNLGFAQLGNLTSTLSLYTPIYILSGFNAGIITALTFAQQIAALPNALVTTQFSSVAGIKFNELYSEQKIPEINKVFSDAANLLHFVMIPISCLLFLYSSQIVDILTSITSIDQVNGKYIALFLKFLGLILPFYVSNTLIARLFMASHKIREAFWFQVIFNLLQIGAIYFAVRTWGVIGYPVTLVIVYATSTLLYYFVERRYFKFINYTKIILNLISFAAVNVLLGISVFYLLNSLDIESSWGILAIASTLQFTLLFIVNSVLGMNTFVTLQIQTLTNGIQRTRGTVER